MSALSESLPAVQAWIATAFPEAQILAHDSEMWVWHLPHQEADFMLMLSEDPDMLSLAMPMHVPPPRSTEDFGKLLDLLEYLPPGFVIINIGMGKSIELGLCAKLALSTSLTPAALDRLLANLIKTYHGLGD